MPTAWTLSTAVSPGIAAIALGNRDSACAAAVRPHNSATASIFFPEIDMVLFLGGGLGRHRLGQVVRDLVEEAGGGEPALIGADQKREVLGHIAVLDRLDADFLQCVGEFRELRIVVE